VQETLPSVLAHTVARIEVIVVDDGSTDDTAAALDDIAAHDPRVRLERQPQSGVATVRNQLARRWRFGCAPGFLIGYRRLPGAMSANWVRMQRSFIAMYQIHRDRADRRGAYSIPPQTRRIPGAAVPQ
jgi:glycosyltransferase involved in cell wall biosynthesis